MYVCKFYFKTLASAGFHEGRQRRKKLKYLQITLNYYYTKLIALYTKMEDV